MNKNNEKENGAAALNKYGSPVFRLMNTNRFNSGYFFLFCYCDFLIFSRYGSSLLWSFPLWFFPVTGY